MAKPLRAGGEVDSWCTKCRLVLNHRIIAMMGPKPVRVECSTCGSHHNYRGTAPGEKAPAGERPARVVAKEIRDFLEHTNIASEMQKMLTTVQFEINTTVRFTPNDTSPPATTEGAEPPPPPRPEVKTQVHVKRDEPRARRRARE